jgi:hypothetical protein
MSIECWSSLTQFTFLIHISLSSTCCKAYNSFSQSLFFIILAPRECKGLIERRRFAGATWTRRKRMWTRRMAKRRPPAQGVLPTSTAGRASPTSCTSGATPTRTTARVSRRARPTPAPPTLTSTISTRTGSVFLFPRR